MNYGSALADNSTPPSKDPSFLKAAATAGTLSDQISDNTNPRSASCNDSFAASLPTPSTEIASPKQLVGAVVATVNATPIYANQVLDPLKKEFALKAKQLSPEEFRQFASQEISRKLKELIEDELTFSAAYYGLKAEDRKLAEVIASQVRKQRITAAQGSEAQARRKSLEQGLEFDEAMRLEYRRIVRSLYAQRHFEPLIQVSPDEMREFYRMNASKLYSDHDKAQFRVIKIDPAVSGGVKAAMDKAQAIHDKATHGQDFTALASKENDDAFLKGRGGSPTDPGEWMDRDSYVNDAVEAALWNIQPGQITPVIQSNHALYIAKLEAKQIGSTKPFEDQKVQDDIYARLRDRKVASLSQSSAESLLSDAVIDSSEAQVQTVLDMAMQKYAQKR